MDPSDIGVFRLAEQRLSWVDDRQRLLAQNIANADTPGFRPSDLVPFADTMAQAMQGPVRTDPKHLAGRSAGVARDSRARPRERAPDGNAVSVETQLTKVADTETTQALVVDLYKKYMSMFYVALGKSA